MSLNVKRSENQAFQTYKITDLHDAAKRGDANAISALCQTQEDVNAENDLGETPFLTAILHGNLGAARALIACGADAHVTANNRKSALHLVCGRGRGNNSRSSDLLEYLLDVHRINPNYLDSRKRTALHEAALFVRPDFVELLLNKEATVMARDYAGTTPLHDAARFLYDRPEDAPDSDRTIQLLLNKGAEVNAQDHLGYTPLHLALKHMKNSPVHFASVKRLVDANANLNAETNEGDTPLHFAARFGTREAYEYLIFKGANPNVPNEKGRTPEKVWTERQEPSYRPRRSRLEPVGEE